MDFTVTRYTRLLQTLLDQGYAFVTVTGYLQGEDENFTAKTQRREENASLRLSASAVKDAKLIILRHDVDARPQYALRLARLERALGIRGTYYFRLTPACFDEAVMREIAALGHEVGYHYETLATVRGEGRGERGEGRLEKGDWKREGGEMKGNWSRETGIYALLQYSVIGNLFAFLGRTFIQDSRFKIQDSFVSHVDNAFQLFKENLARIRAIVPVITICPHGSPLSPFDNREIWTKYDYRELGILGDATIDPDFSRVAYFTDTGRRWDGFRVNVRDRVGRRDGETEGRRDEETERLRDKETEGLRETENDISDPRVEHKSPITNHQSPITNQPSAPYSMPHALSPVPVFHHTCDLIRAIENGTFPKQAMITVHPQRWTDVFWPWLWELIWQNLKNQVKRKIVIHGP